MNDARAGCLVLVPVSLGETAWQRFLPAEAHAEAVSIRHFVVENAKAARAQLKRMEHPLPMTELDITPLPPNGPNDELDRLLGPTARGLDVGLMSDAGCPGIADPGARLVARAHALNVRVRPLVGPSSILLALMASGTARADGFGARRPAFCLRWLLAGRRGGSRRAHPLARGGFAAAVPHPDLH